MNAGLIITHITALAVGIALASGWAPKNSIEPTTDAASEISGPEAKTRVRVDAVTYERKLASLAGLSGNPEHLRQLRGEMIREWAAKRPLEVLNYLESRPWDPYVGGTPEWLPQLARDQPDALLDYAIRTGCKSSLACLATEGDPHASFSRFLALGEARLPSETIHDLFEHAAGIDPEFHHELGRLESPELREAAAEAIADSLLETHRFDDLIELLTNLPLGVAHETMVGAIVEGFAETYAATEFLLDLPGESRELVIDGLLRQVEEAGIAGEDSDKQFHELMTLLQTNGLDQGREAIIAASIAEGSFSVSSHFLEEEASREKITDRWTAWARDLPDDTAWQSAKLAAYQRATTASPTRWQELLEIPEPAIRDLALASCVDIVDADAFPEIANQIEDPSLRAAALDYLEWGKGNWDPFGPESEYPEPLPWQIAPSEESGP